MSRTYNPSTLTTLSRKAVNTELPTWNSVWKLPIPRTLQMECRNHYLCDKLENSKNIPECFYKTLDWFTFHEPWIFVNPDIYLAIMNWKMELKIPDFCAFECTIVTFMWYEELGDDLLAPPKWCRSCALESEKPIVMHKTWELYRPWSVMLEVFQNEFNWCANCTTTTLFKIMEHPFAGCKRRFWDSIISDSDSDE